jgi:hypothetical protein
MIGNVPGSAPPDSPRSNSVCPPANRSAAAVFKAANSTSSCGDPMCSIEREPMRQDHTICTAVAPDEVFTVRTYATRAAYGPILVFKFRPNSRQKPSPTSCNYANTPNVSQVGLPNS